MVAWPRLWHGRRNREGDRREARRNRDRISAVIASHLLSLSILREGVICLRSRAVKNADLDSARGFNPYYHGCAYDHSDPLTYPVRSPSLLSVFSAEPFPRTAKKRRCP